jgi:hypothetical protein
LTVPFIIIETKATEKVAGMHNALITKSPGSQNMSFGRIMADRMPPAITQNIAIEQIIPVILADNVMSTDSSAVKGSFLNETGNNPINLDI